MNSKFETKSSSKIKIDGNNIGGQKQLVRHLSFQKHTDRVRFGFWVAVQKNTDIKVKR